VGFSPGGETLVVGGKRGGKTVVEMWKFDGSCGDVPVHEDADVEDAEMGGVECK